MPTQTERKGGWGALYDIQERKRSEREKKNGPPDSQPPQSSQPQGSSQLPQSSQLPEQPPAGYGSSQPQGSSQPPQSSQPQRSSQLAPAEPINLMGSLPEVRGHVELPHQITDHLFRHLDAYEQAVFIQLYRLSWGFGSNLCFISNPRLAERANMSEAQAKKIIARLVGKGLVRKTGNIQGYGKNQGVEYEVSAPSWQAQRSSQLQQSSQPQRSSQLSQSTNKGKVLKEIEKGDASQCPDCFGTGWWYPEGTAKGVKQCAHPRLMLKAE